MEEDTDAPAVPAAPPVADSAAVVSETDHHSSADEEGWLRHTHVRRNRRRAINDETSHDEESDDGEDVLKEAAGPGDLYDGNMDDENEAYVYKNMRGGTEELVHLRRQPQDAIGEQGDRTETSDNNEDANAAEGGPDTKKSTSEKGGGDESTPQQKQQLQQARLLKPRNSDAILSCPRCFNIVCMDCQQHERYANQYRAMFVMNIGVDWDKRATYDEAAGSLKLVAGGAEAGEDGDAAPMQLDDDSGEPASIPVEHAAPGNSDEKGELYYSVHCGYCQLELAALDMKDEIYYFFGCIASA
ncbi:hypothetical protein ACHAXT_006698 [Thalassiosira profunda]